MPELSIGLSKTAQGDDGRFLRYGRRRGTLTRVPSGRYADTLFRKSDFRNSTKSALCCLLRFSWNWRW
jgi:hypothetical protein